MIGVAISKETNNISGHLTGKNSLNFIKLNLNFIKLKQELLKSC